MRTLELVTTFLQTLVEETADFEQTLNLRNRDCDELRQRVEELENKSTDEDDFHTPGELSRIQKELEEAKRSEKAYALSLTDAQQRLASARASHETERRKWSAEQRDTVSRIFSGCEDWADAKARVDALVSTNDDLNKKCDTFREQLERYKNGWDVDQVRNQVEEFNRLGAEFQKYKRAVEEMHGEGWVAPTMDVCIRARRILEGAGIQIPTATYALFDAVMDYLEAHDALDAFTNSLEAKNKEIEKLQGEVTRMEALITAHADGTAYNKLAEELKMTKFSLVGSEGANRANAKTINHLNAEVEALTQQVVDAQQGGQEDYVAIKASLTRKEQEFDDLHKKHIELGQRQLALVDELDQLKKAAPVHVVGIGNTVNDLVTKLTAERDRLLAQVNAKGADTGYIESRLESVIAEARGSVSEQFNSIDKMFDEVERIIRGEPEGGTQQSSEPV